MPNLLNPADFGLDANLNWAALHPSMVLRTGSAPFSMLSSAQSESATFFLFEQPRTVETA